MKIRSVKLRVAHKNTSGAASFCSILWDNQGQYVVTASSSDNSICVHDALLPSNTPQTLKYHRDGVTILAISPNSTCLASGSIDHSVKLYKFPTGEFQTNITRFTLPIRALAFNKSGTLLAAAGDDEGIKLINTIDGSIASVLKGHKGSVTGIAFDPKSEYFASIDSVGTVIFWELQSGSIIHTLKSIAPGTNSDNSVMNLLNWSPDGDVLAVPGLKNDVIMYDRDTAEKIYTLKGDHVQPVCSLSWSPNGKYLATSGLDRQVLIWDIDKKQDIGRQKFDDRICSMAWKPHGNALAVIDVMGKYGLWESIVPSSMKSPTEGIIGKTSNGLLLMDEDMEEEEQGNSDGLSDLGEDSYSESEPMNKKRVRRQFDYDDDLDEEFGLDSQHESFKRSSHHQKEKNRDIKEVPKVASISPVPIMQEAFQPGATPVQPGKIRFLCYNMLGSITTMEHDGYSHVEIDFHDTGVGPRVPAMTDYFGFTMAALNENGSVFANPCKGEKNMSTLMYRPFSSWANNSEWSMRFEEEEVRAVALGGSWVAAVTSLNFLRIFTDGGLQRHVLSLNGSVLTVTGFKDELAVVTHVTPFSTNDQVLEFTVFNVRYGTMSISGRLPLTPASCLTWFGFSEEGQLSSFDSKGVLRVFTKQYGGSWLPLFSASKLKKSEESYWVVGLNASKLFCIICKSPEKFPQAIPKPILTLLDLSFPLASSDLGAETLENEFIINSMHLEQIQRRIEEVGAAGEDTTSLDDEAFNVEAALDRCILRLIATCCNGDKLVRATELVKLLSLDKSVKGAIKLATALKLPNLAERFNMILEGRLANSKASAVSETKSISVASIQANPSAGTFISPESLRRPEPTDPLQPQKPSSSLFTRKEIMDESGKVKMEKEQTAKLEKSRGTKNQVWKGSEDVKSSEQVKKTGEVNLVQSRPSNPFAKTSSNQEKATLFDSLKKMKVDGAGKK